MKKVAFVLILYVLVTFSGFSQDKISYEKYPEVQVAFFNERQKFCELYDDQINEIKASKIYSQTNDYSNLFIKANNLEINSWEGTLKRISTDKGGNYLDVVIESEINNYHITFQNTRTFGVGGIEKGTAVYNQIEELAEGQNVVFTGKFKDERGNLAEYSLTERGSVCNPTFEINILEVLPSSNTKIHKTGGLIGGFIEGFTLVFSLLKYVAIIALIIFIINLIKKSSSRKMEDKN